MTDLVGRRGGRGSRGRGRGGHRFLGGGWGGWGWPGYGWPWYASWSWPYNQPWYGSPWPWYGYSDGATAYGYSSSPTYEYEEEVEEVSGATPPEAGPKVWRWTAPPAEELLRRARGRAALCVQQAARAAPGAPVFAHIDLDVAPVGAGLPPGVYDLWQVMTYQTSPHASVEDAWRFVDDESVGARLVTGRRPGYAAIFDRRVGWPRPLVEQTNDDYRGLLRA